MIAINKLKEEDVKRLTKDQKSSIETEGRIIISASAGSGKTSTMVLKILTLLTNGKHLKDMLIVVYNEAAAAELKQKLYNKLVDMISDPNVEDSIANKLVEEVQDIEFCQISTIHAFCRSLVKENFTELGISPLFDILDEQKEAKLKDDALNKVFASYPENDETFSDILEIFSNQRKEDNLKSNILGLYQTYYIQPDKDGFKEQIKKCYECDIKDSYFVSYLFANYKKIIECYSSKINDAYNAIKDSQQEQYKYNFVNDIEMCDYLLRSNNLFNLCEAAYNYPEYERRKFSKNQKDPMLVDIQDNMLIGEKCSKELKSFVPKLAAIYLKKDTLLKAHIQNKKYIDKFIEILEKVHEEFMRLKQEENKYTFDDLLHFAIELIKNKQGGLDKYEYVFVDEYQDVSPLTAYITNAFVDKNSFLVGDVKQSIYGFNLADPTIFLNREDEYKNNGDTAISFNRNFRSRKKVLSFVNDVFSAIMTKSNADIDYYNDAKFELDGVKEGGEVEIHILHKPAELKAKADGKALDKIYDITQDNSFEDDANDDNIEGKFIANKIKNLVEDVNYIHDENDNPVRIKYSDIAILFMSRNSTSNKIISAIKDENIPVDDSTFTIDKNNPEYELVTLLRVIDNPKQDIYLAGYMLSFFGGYSEEELVKIASNNSGSTFYDKVVQASTKKDALGMKLSNTLKTLEEYRIKASFKNVTDLMNGIVSDFSYDAYLIHSGMSDVNSLKTFINGKINRKGDSLSEFINDYSKNEKNNSASASSNAVKVSTFHAFKGLECPIVFIANITGKFNTLDKKKDLLFTGNGNIGMQYFDLINKTKDDSISSIALTEIITSKIQKERMRLLYVALTRAKERMYITGMGGKDSGEAVPNIIVASNNLDFIRQAKCFGSHNISIQHEEYSVINDTKEEEINDDIDPKVVDGIKESQSFVYPYEIDTHLGMKYGVSSLVSDTDGIQYVYESSADVGTIYHKVMQNIDYSTSSIKGIEAEFNRFVEENTIAKEDLDKVDKSLILQCLQQDFMKEALKASKVGKTEAEKKFTMYIEANKVSNKKEFQSNEKVLVQGIVDLFIDGDEPMIVDFKYSNLTDAFSIDTYRKQLLLYKTAMEGLIGRKINKVLLYSFKNGKKIYIEE